MEVRWSGLPAVLAHGRRRMWRPHRHNPNEFVSEALARYPVEGWTVGTLVESSPQKKAPDDGDPAEALPAHTPIICRIVSRVDQWLRTWTTILATRVTRTAGCSPKAELPRDHPPKTCALSVERILIGRITRSRCAATKSAARLTATTSKGRRGLTSCSLG